MIKRFNRNTSVLLYLILTIPVGLYTYLLFRGLNSMPSLFYSFLSFAIVYMLLLRRMYWVNASGNRLKVTFFNLLTKKIDLDCYKIIEVELDVGGDAIEDEIQYAFIKRVTFLHITVIGKNGLETYSLANNMTFNVEKLYVVLEKFITIQNSEQDYK